MSLDMQQFHESFFDESAEHLDELERVLMALDLDDPDPEDLDSVFRAAHSIKGGSGIFGFDALGAVTHIMENLLDRAREGKMVLDTPTVDLLLSTSDTLRSILAAYRAGEEPDWGAVNRSSEALEKSLRKLDGQSQTSSEEGDNEAEHEGFGFFDTPTKGSEEAEPYGFFDEPAPDKATGEGDEGFGFFEPLPEETEGQNQERKNDGRQEFFNELLTDSEGESAQTTSSRAQNHDNRINASENAAAPQTKPDKQQTKGSKGKDKKARPAATTAKSSAAESSSIRVDVDKVDHLINLVGELVITQSMLMEIGKEVEGPASERLDRVLGDLERNTREMQESVMSVRMMPISFAFSRFPRVVRDLSGKLGKKVELVLEGSETELDKGLIEKLVDPLTHLVRNSIDHGVEMPEKRRDAGKQETGTVTLRALQQGGNVIIEVADDGGGLNREVILEKAEEKGVEVPENPTDQEVWELIMAPGFSTAAAVTEVSGRGVGMDVVKRNLETLGGRLEIRSTQGEGTSFLVQLPLTLAIVDGMGLNVGEQTFILPLVNILESMAPEPGAVKTLAGEDQLLSVRDQFWPVVPLHKVMNAEDAKARKPGEGIMILVEAGRRRFALQVDELLGQQQVVIKSLEQHYRRVPGVAGATIMGDGSVALILDAQALAGMARQVSNKETEPHE